MAVVAAGAILLTSCGDDNDESAQANDDSTQSTDGDASNTDTIKVTIVGPLTGDASVYGIGQANGFQLAVDELNAAGGVDGHEIEVESLDDQADPNQAATIAQQICDDESTSLVVGHATSGATLAASPIYDRCGLPELVLYASNPTVTRQGFEHLYRAILADDAVGKEMGTIAAEMLEIKRMGLIVAPDDYGKGLRDIFKPALEELGVEVVVVEQTSPDQKDFTPQLTKMKDAGVDGISLLNFYADAALQVKQARELGIDATIFASVGANNPDLISIAGDASEGTFVHASFNVGSDRPEVVEFVKNYTDKYGEPPSEVAAIGYDSAYILKAAIEAGASGSRESVAEGFAALGEVERPLTPPLNWNEFHEPEPYGDSLYTVLLVVKDGKLVDAEV